GIVWSFTVEPYSVAVQSIVVTASSEDPGFTAENTINGSGLDEADLHGADATTMWLSNVGDPAVWIQYAFDRAYKLDKMLVWNSNQELELVLGFGVKEVTLEVSTNGTDWTALENVQQFAQAPGAAGYAANTIVDFNGAMVQFVRISVNSGYGPLGRYGLSEVRFFYIPTFATRPNPETGATDVAPDVMLTWGRDGREASSHDVYVGLNPDDLTLAGTVSESSFDTLALDLQLGETYSWRVDEVNEAMDPSTWIGDVWSFTTADAISIDDMESYEDAELLEIWATWVDGFEDPTNGSLVGNGTAGTPETDLVHGGSQSLPMHYDNSAAAQSEATRTFKAPMDWTGHGVQGLVLYFQGSASNTGGSLYIKINDTKVTYDGDPAALMRGGWNKWYIPLADVAGNLSGITSLTIGIDGGGTGVVYVDDIFLTDGARELVTPAEPSNIGLAGHYKLDQDATDSSGNNNHGALGGDPQWVAGKIGSALDFDGDDYVDLGNPSQLDFGTGSWSVSAWMKMPASTDNSNIFSKGGDNSGGIRYMLNVSETDDHKACLTLDDNVTKVQSTSSVTVDDGQWHHIVGLRDGSSLRLYVDGALDGTNTLAAGYDLSGTSQANAYIGAGWNFDTSVVQKFLIGMIDDVRIYSQALSAEEIAWLAGRTQPFDKP
ncbi:MAG: LamG-like jellyroll fold domain-containing protein, partial [Planctomycetota bacterium]